MIQEKRGRRILVHMYGDTLAKLEGMYPELKHHYERVDKAVTDLENKNEEE